MTCQSSPELDQHRLTKLMLPCCLALLLSQNSVVKPKNVNHNLFQASAEYFLTHYLIFLIIFFYRQNTDDDTFLCTFICSEIHFKNFDPVMVMIVWLLDLQQPIHSLAITTNIVNSNPAHYDIKFVSMLWQVSGFLRVLRFPPPIKRTTTI